MQIPHSLRNQKSLYQKLLINDVGIGASWRNIKGRTRKRMMKKLQILVFVLFTFVFGLTPYYIWLGVWPELTLFEYLTKWQTYGTILSGTFFYFAIAAYLLGWNPQVAFLVWLRRVVIHPLLNKPSSLIFISIFLLILFVVEVKHVYEFDKNYSKDIVSAILSEDYDGADELIGKLNASSSEIELLSFINDSVRQQFLLTSQSADRETCQTYANDFSTRRVYFESVWSRYLIKLAHAACLQVLEDLKGAIYRYREAHKLAGWISPDEEKYALRRIATIYFYDSNGVSGIKDREERLRNIIQLLSTDASPTAQRMLGSSYYLLGEYAKTAELWTKYMDGLGNDKSLEKKKLLNNIAMAYQAQSQLNLARQKVEAGIAISYDENNERERREQVRLLSTKTLIQVEQGQCDEAEVTWSDRNSLSQRGLSKCASLITAQVLSCGSDAGREERLLRSLVQGVGQDCDTFIDYTESSLRGLVTQAGRTFRDCYLGLVFPERRILNTVIGSFATTSTP